MHNIINVHHLIMMPYHASNRGKSMFTLATLTLANDFTYFHYITKYGITRTGNLSCNKNILTPKKINVRTVVGAK
jgi:hypothetical protein